MKIERTEQGYWLCYGQGPRRSIVAEGDTAEVAKRAYAHAWYAQYMERYDHV